jgi:hypothetical protein
MQSVIASPDKTFVFKKAEWEYTETEQGTAVKGIPGTWTPPYSEAPNWLLGIISCPSCGTNLLLDNKIHNVDRLGKIHPTIQCNSCSFTRVCFLDEWNKKPLYACAIEIDGEPQIHYMHAATQVAARAELGQVAYKKSFRIVALGRAVGFIASDSHGEKLTADVFSPETGTNGHKRGED